MGCVNSKSTLTVARKQVAFEENYYNNPLPDKFDFLNCIDDTDKYLEDIPYKGKDDII